MNLDFHEKFRDVIMKMEKAGNSYAEAKGQSWQSQELKYAVLASIMNGMKDIAVTTREAIAKGHPDYVAYVKETSELIKTELRFKCEYEKWKNSFEALRSLSSLEKHTQNQLGE